MRPVRTNADHDVGQRRSRTRSRAIRRSTGAVRAAVGVAEVGVRLQHPGALRLTRAPATNGDADLAANLLGVKQNDFVLQELSPSNVAVEILELGA